MNPDESSQTDPQRATDILLIFPPVWVPMVPHLAIPTLTAYLRQKGFRVAPMDTNVAFFTDYLLTKETLSPFLSVGREILHGSSARKLPPKWKKLLEREMAGWERWVSHPEEIFAVFRNKDEFLDPNRVLPAQDRLLGLLYLCTIAHWPEEVTFNHYRRDDIKTLNDLIEICEDPHRNLFLPFWRDRILPEIRRLSPLTVGISISSIHQFVAALTLGRLLRKEFPQVHVVVGGKHLLNIQHKILRDPLMFRTFFHSAILFEGERPLEKLLRSLASGGPLRDVPNLTYLERQEIVTTNFLEPVPLEDLPLPDFQDTPWEKYLVPVRYAPVRMAEGCYWGKCTFCARYGPDRTAFVPPERVVDELEFLGEVYDIHDVSVNDDCLPPSHWEAVSEEILRRGLRLSMLIWAKPVAGFTRKRLEKMARAGVKQIRWGVESAEPRILRLMKKGTTLESTLRVLQDAHDLGIWNHACIIIGFPTETREEAQVTLDFIRNHHKLIQSFILYPFALYENTHIYRHPEAFGIRDIQTEATPLSDRISYTIEQGISPAEARILVPQAKKSLLDEVYAWPFWFFLKLREYLQLYLDRYGLKGVLTMPFERDRLRRFFSEYGN